MTTNKVVHRFPPKLKMLQEAHRYKIMYGGRGGGKSWAVARYLLLLAASKPMRVLCAREFQSSIKDSVHSLLSDQIKALGLIGAYNVKQTEIEGMNGSQFAFVGLRHNPMSLKSYEGVDICWIEEAQTVSKHSWDILIPTIRKEGSEIWATFNPILETDETYQRFVLNPPPDASIVKINYSDNPWFPDVLDKERLYLKERDPDAYLNVWEGHCRQTLDGAIYAKELREAQEEGRIGHVPYDKTKGVSVYVDLGWADKTSMWLAQSIGMEYRVIDFLEDRQRPWVEYLKEIQNKSYLIDKIILPHDAASKQLATGRSIEEMTKQAGFKCEVLPRLGIEQGINAARTVFGQCWFDAERCADGLQALRHYRYDVDDNGQFSRKPLHDENSHACLAEGTQVLLSNGWRAIEDIEVGDYVCLGSIKARVDASECTGLNRTLRIEFTDGTVIYATPEHKFLTTNGLCLADALRYNTQVFTEEAVPCKRTLKGKGVREYLHAKHSTGGDFIRDRTAGITHQNGRSTVLCTAPYGNSIMVRFLMGITYTIKMAIEQTMGLRILSAYPPASIPSFTHKQMNGLGQRPIKSSSWQLAKRQRNGTVQRKEENGIQSMAKRLGRIANQRLRLAFFAEKDLKHHTLPVPNSAIKTVKLITEGGEKRTFDLTVNHHHAYIANGVLVSNSDAFRYLAMAISNRAPRKRVERMASSGWMG